MLWDSCAQPLRSLNLPYQQQRDSDKRRQLTADIEDLLLAFDALDSGVSIPPIYCEASELYKLPPISLDPLAEQVESNSQVLHDLKSAVERLESTLSSCPLITSDPNSGDHSSDQSTTYASKVASFTPPASNTPSLTQWVPSLFGPLIVIVTLSCLVCLRLTPSLNLKRLLTKFLSSLQGSLFKLGTCFVLARSTVPLLLHRSLARGQS